jgi:hypothetical protein
MNNTRLEFIRDLFDMIILSFNLAVFLTIIITTAVTLAVAKKDAPSKPMLILLLLFSATFSGVLALLKLQSLLEGGF